MGVEELSRGGGKEEVVEEHLLEVTSAHGPIGGANPAGHAPLQCCRSFRCADISCPCLLLSSISAAGGSASHSRCMPGNPHSHSNPIVK